jgi:hypothetical protein
MSHYQCAIFYFVAENLVLWARSETIGYAVNPAASGTGMMEYWNVGMLGLEEWDLFLLRMPRISI